MSTVKIYLGSIGFCLTGRSFKTVYFPYFLHKKRRSMDQLNDGITNGMSNVCKRPKTAFHDWPVCRQVDSTAPHWNSCYFDHIITYVPTTYCLEENKQADIFCNVLLVYCTNFVNHKNMEPDWYRKCGFWQMLFKFALWTFDDPLDSSDLMRAHCCFCKRGRREKFCGHQIRVSAKVLLSKNYVGWLPQFWELKIWIFFCLIEVRSRQRSSAV